MDRALQRLHFLADDVEADPAARGLGDRRRRGEAGAEDELEGVLGRQGFRLRHGYERLLDRRTADAGGVDAASVVRDLHQHLVSFPARPQPDTALLGLARRPALLGPLEAVIHRVADEMEERLLERVQDGAIELGAFALDLQEDSFPGLAAEVPHHP